MPVAEQKADPIAEALKKEEKEAEGRNEAARRRSCR